MEQSVEVAIIMGSKSDWAVMENSAKLLAQFGVSYDARVLSAHRTPEALAEQMETYEKNGLRVYIAAAGLAAHLGGVIASHTLLPVIGVPMDAGTLQGVDALYSMVQMPPGIPVSVMGIGKPGAVNAALYAVSILALAEPAYREKLVVYRKEQAQKVLSEKLDLP